MNIRFITGVKSLLILLFAFKPLYVFATEWRESNYATNGKYTLNATDYQLLDFSSSKPITITTTGDLYLTGTGATQGKTYLNIAFDNQYTLTLEETRLLKNVTGTGNLFINGNVYCDAYNNCQNITNKITINSSADLSIVPHAIKSNILTNNGTLRLYNHSFLMQTLNTNISGSGNTYIGNNISTNADLLNTGIIIDHNSSLFLTGGHISKIITGVDGSSILHIDGLVFSNANNVRVRTDISPLAQLYLTDGTLTQQVTSVSSYTDSYGITHNGTIVIDGSVKIKTTPSVNNITVLDKGHLNFYNNASLASPYTATKLTLQNATLDIANGYTETFEIPTLSLTGANTLKLDIDTTNKAIDNLVVINQLDLSDTNKLAIDFNPISINRIDDTLWFATLHEIDTGEYFTLLNDHISTTDKTYTLALTHNDNKWGINIVSATNNETSSGADELITNNADKNENLFRKLKTYTSGVTHLLSQIVRNMTNSMEKRIGELQWGTFNTSSNSKNGVWTRGIYKNDKYQKINIAQYGIEFGYDHMIYHTNKIKAYFGGMGYISTSDSQLEENNLNGTSYGLGIYGMILGNNGWYGDATIREHIIDLDNISQYTATTLNIETGVENVFKTKNKNLNLFIKPAVETTIIYLSDTTVYDSINIDNGLHVLLNANIIAGPRWTLKKGMVQTYGKIGYTADVAQNTSITIENGHFKYRQHINATEFGIGIDYKTRNNAINLYLETSYSTGDNFKEIGGNLGIRYIF